MTGGRAYIYVSVTKALQKSALQKSALQKRFIYIIIHTHQRYESFVTRVQARHPLCVTVGTPMGSQWDPSGTLVHNSFGISCRSSAFGTRLGLKRDIVAQSPKDLSLIHI